GMAQLGVPASGRIPAGELAGPGRVIGRLSDIGWGTRLRELVGGDDAPVPGDVLDACVRVLAGWGWERRPARVVGIGARARPHWHSAAEPVPIAQPRGHTPIVIPAHQLRFMCECRSRCASANLFGPTLCFRLGRLTACSSVLVARWAW